MQVAECDSLDSFDATNRVAESTKSGAFLSGGLRRRDGCWKTRAPMIRASGPFKKPLEIIKRRDNAVIAR